MELPIKYRLRNGWIEIRMDADEHWHQYRKTRSKHSTKLIPITQSFGKDFWYNEQWFYKDYVGGLRGHNGIDLEAPTGTCLYAPENGTITAVDDNSYGKKIRLKSRQYEHVFGHLAEWNVAIGNKVKAGQLIGWCNNTGKFTTGSHLHWGVRPIKYDKDNGYSGYVDHREFLDMTVYKLPYRDGMFIQRTDVKNGGHGELYEVVDGLLAYYDSKKIGTRIPIVDRILRLMKEGIEPKSLTSINEKEFKKFKHLII
jgi:murein DD-endopeptidase MepM/ murein hydrolase activator NlpD